MDPERPSFESKWPELAARVEASLRRRCVPSWLRDDVVQETGLRLFKMWDDVDPERSPTGLALTIANNILWDAVARHRDREVLGDVPDAPADQDVERSGMARMELARVSRSMKRLSPAHRSILLAEIDDAIPRPDATPAAVKMLRMRARRRLSALLEHASAVGMFVSLGIRKRMVRLRTLVERTALLGDGAAAAVSGLVATVAIVTGVAVVAQAGTPVNIGTPAIARIRASAATSETDAVRSGVTQATARGAMAPQRAVSDRRNKDATQRYEVPFGGGPVDGGATVEVRDNGEEGIVVIPPECGVSRPSEHKFRVSCTGGRVNSTEVDVTVEFEVRPPDPEEGP
ncbi:MAG: RNA polymerase sigma factor [Actinomycetota bacterium]